MAPPFSGRSNGAESPPEAAVSAARQSRNRTARSVWSAWSLLPLSNHPRLTTAPASWTHSKRFAWQIAHKNFRSLRTTWTIAVQCRGPSRIPRRPSQQDRSPPRFPIRLPHSGYCQVRSLRHCMPKLKGIRLGIAEVVDLARSWESQRDSGIHPGLRGTSYPGMPRRRPRNPEIPVAGLVWTLLSALSFWCLPAKHAGGAQTRVSGELSRVLMCHSGAWIFQIKRKSAETTSNRERAQMNGRTIQACAVRPNGAASRIGSQHRRAGAPARPADG